MNRKKIIIFLIFLIVSAIIIGSGIFYLKFKIAERVKKDYKKDNNKNQSENRDYKIGQPVDINGKVITVNEVYKDWKPLSDFNKKFGQAQIHKKYVVLKLTIKNNKKDKIKYSPSDFEVIDANGRINSVGAGGTGELEILKEGYLDSGESVTGNLVFQIYDNALSDLTLVCYFDWLKGEQEKNEIKLQSQEEAEKLALLEKREYSGKVVAKKINDLEIIINSVEKGWKPSYEMDDLPDKNKTYVMIRLTIVNKGEKVKKYSSSNFGLKDSKGRIFYNKSTIQDIYNLSIGKIDPGDKASGDLLFEIDKSGLDNFSLIYYLDILEDKGIEINLR